MLEEGEYYIIPSTFYRQEKGEFYLSIYSENSVDIELQKTSLINNPNYDDIAEHQNVIELLYKKYESSFHDVYENVYYYKYIV